MAMNNHMQRLIEADEKGLSALAVQLARQLIVTQPEHVVRVQLILAENLRLLGRYSEASAALAQIHDVNVPQLWLIRLQRGQIASDQGRFDEAEKFFREALQLRPDSTIPYVYLCTCLRAQERFHEAIDLLECSGPLKGDLDELALNLALAYRALGRYDEAIQKLEHALKVSPDYFDAELCLRDCQMAKRAVEECRDVEAEDEGQET